MKTRKTYTLVYSIDSFNQRNRVTGSLLKLTKLVGRLLNSDDEEFKGKKVKEIHLMETTMTTKDGVNKFNTESIVCYQP